TDFEAARDAVEVVRTRFVGAPMFDDQGEPYLDEENQSKYAGKPSDSIDEAWDELIHDRYFLISDEEANEAWGPDYILNYRTPDKSTEKGGYLAGLEVFHTLHCLNVLRMQLYANYYHGSSNDTGRAEQYHLDHCIDMIRQTIQCFGDLSPVPHRWWPGLGKPFIYPTQMHTCRNFTKIRAWASQR
ncbi:hypothetical protein CERZMDRAFT_13606, partial [Cercospora zeae-maydis SCOH1-5]